MLGGLLLLLAWLGTRAPIAADSALPWFIVAALVVAFGLGALAGAWHVGRESRSAARAYDAVTSAGQRMLSSGADYRIPLPPDPDMHAIVALLNSFADHRDAQVERAADRDAQLALSRRLTGWMYWEQDAQGRYTRIECETEDRGAQARVAELFEIHELESRALPFDPPLPVDAPARMTRRPQQRCFFVAPPPDGCWHCKTPT